jgi:capsular exopolysaccharide synthesis family protein
VMVREQNVSVLRAPGEAFAYFALPELGVIPDAEAGKRSKPASIDPAPRTEGALIKQASPPLMEAFRGTAASILSRNGRHPRIVVVTSSRPMEGKTTTVSHLGIALAEVGRTLLIDGDMRNPRLHGIFGQENGRGLSEFLSEGDSIDGLPADTLVRTTAVPQLYLLPSGAPADHIFSLLHSNRMSRLLGRFREEFEFVLVDAPPCLEFADARNMAQHAEGLVLVARANYTDRRTVQAAVERLERDGARIMGIILNRWNPSRDDRYYYPAFRGAPRTARTDWKPRL